MRAARPPDGSTAVGAAPPRDPASTCAARSLLAAVRADRAASTPFRQGPPPTEVLFARNPALTCPLPCTLIPTRHAPPPRPWTQQRPRPDARRPAHLASANPDDRPARYDDAGSGPGWRTGALNPARAAPTTDRSPGGVWISW